MKLLKQIASLLLLSASFSSTAGSGKAIVPFWGTGSSNTPTYIYVSNITDNYINVDIKFINQHGTTLSPGTYSNFTSNNTQLAPGKSGYVNISASSSTHGYATIEWSNVEGDDDTVALLAHGIYLIVETSRRTNSAIPINNGLPF